MDLVGKAGLADALSGPGKIKETLDKSRKKIELSKLIDDTETKIFASGPFTVFAPTNDAFAEVDGATLKSILDDTSLLKNVLTYHVVASALPPSSITNELTPASLAGESLRVNVYGTGADEVSKTMCIFNTMGNICQSLNDNCCIVVLKSWYF